MVVIVIGALLIGLSLGLMGSGGSILTMPLLKYLLDHNAKVAAAESLAIVGVVALVSIVPYAKARQVDWRSVFFFGVPGMFGAYLGAAIAGFVSEAFQLSLFALVMLTAAVMMFRVRVTEREDTRQKAMRLIDAIKIGGEGLAVGILTGLVGVGGGFLIVPALVLLGGLPMRLAVGTSLVVISMKSATGLLKYIDVLQDSGLAIDWPTVAAFASIGVIGSLIGKRLSNRLDQATLRRAFAVFLTVMGLFVLGQEAPRTLFPKTESPDRTAAAIDSVPAPANSPAYSSRPPQERNAP